LKTGKVEDSEQMKGHASIVYDEAKRLSRMVDDLLDIARIKSGKESIVRVEADLIDVIEKAAANLKPKAEEKQLRVYLVFAKQPIRITFDPDKIYQVTTNLLDNAIKYTPEHGTIQVLADEIPAMEVQGDVFIASFAQISVSDTGIGIPQNDRERVFDEFFRTGNAVGTKELGTGLGLSICRGIVQAHGGRIWVESQPGKGSKFIFTLPNYQPISKLAEYKARS